ncbi:DUF1707 SHOCT-like domain-containing protein [Propionibacteriaceae bacterium G1746]|uniref:DUF1707 SHOCT-like domain-containing protein n=1 Tax=Aestuariimicrobium sp. G57 TaxID=3418485 RepID=UPI003C29E095
MAEEFRLRAGDTDRDAVLSVLQEALVAGRLDRFEFDERQTQVMSAKFLDELPPVVADLPEGGALVMMQGHAGQAALAATTGPTAGLAQRPAGAVAPVDPSMTSVAVMSGRNLVPEYGTTEVKQFSFWGGDDIDLGRAFGPGVEIELSMFVVMGGNTVYVPAGVRVIDETVAVMGGNDVRAKAQGDGSNGVLRLTGLAFMGGSSIKRSKLDTSQDD